MIALLLHCFLIAQDFPKNPPQVRHNADGDFAAIVQAIVNERIRAQSEAPEGHYLVVAAETATAPFEPVDEAPTLALPQVPPEMKARLISENRESTKLPQIHASNVRMVPMQTITALFAGGGWWTEFYRRFPKSKGYLQVSKPAFSDDHQNALIYAAHACGGLCGTGWILYLSHDGGTWHIADKYMLWIS